jgi:hypothetical protein
MKWLLACLAALWLSACSHLDPGYEEPPKTAPAMVGVVNHTGNYIYSASVNGAGGGNMSAWGAGGASICCASIPRVWYPGMKVRVRWNMPVRGNDVIKEKVVEVEKYDEPGSIYLHFFPNDEVRVVVTSLGPNHPDHPIPPLETTKARVGVINHTSDNIYSAGTMVGGSGDMTAWESGINCRATHEIFCYASIPRVWYPSMKIVVGWRTPIDKYDMEKSKTVEVEKYDEPGDIFLHFFPNDEVRVIVSPVGPGNPKYPIPLPVKPATTK